MDDWLPLIPSSALRAGENIVALEVEGQELAAWRSVDGRVQLWEDRCPHRGMRLSLGTHRGDHVACAYHGWSWRAGDGQCLAIPAHPRQPVPDGLCVRTFEAREAGGMVLWRRGLANALPLLAPPAAALAAEPAAPQGGAPFRTADRQLLDDWLTIGPVAHYATATAAAPVTTRLLGAELRVALGDDGDFRADAGGGALAIQQRYGYLWVCPSGRPARPLFALPEHDEPGRRIVDCGGLEVATSGLRMVENFLDMAHFPYVHAGILGEVPHTEVAPYSVEIDAASDEIVARDCRFHQPRASGVATGAIEAQYRYRVMQPLTTMLYKTSIPRPDALDVITLFVQPLDEERIVAHCLLVLFDDASSDEELIAFQRMILAQDKPIVENQRPRRLPLRGGETPARCDALSATYRRWLRERGVRYGAITEGAGSA